MNNKNYDGLNFEQFHKNCEVLKVKRNADGKVIDVQGLCPECFGLIALENSSQFRSGFITSLIEG